MREIRQSGSEGGGNGNTGPPYPYLFVQRNRRLRTHFEHDAAAGHIILPWRGREEDGRIKSGHDEWEPAMTEAAAVTRAI